MKKKILSASALLCAISFIIDSAHADEVFKNDPVVVTASRYETSVSKEGKDISVVTEDEIKKSGKKTLADVLETIPGVTVNRKGVDGGITNIYIRGSQSSNVLIMIDGVRISDPMGIQKLYDISGIMTSNIERIEVVKGAMSSMYGAEASGGVINIITKRGAGRSVTITGEYGSNNTFAESVSVSDSTDRSSFFFSGSHYKTDGISKAKRSASVSSYDDDSYENITASAKMDTGITDTTALSFTMNYSDSDMELDDSSFEDDPNHVYISKLFSSRGDFTHTPFAWWTYKAGISYMNYVREDVDPGDPADATENDAYLYNGSNTGADFLCRFNLMDFNILTLGTEVLNEKGSSTSAYYDSWALPPGFTTGIFNEKSVTTTSFFINDEISLSDMVFYNIGARCDSHSEFGMYWTWDTSLSIIIPITETKLKASAGTGFRAPSLFELYDSNYGNRELEPEKSVVYDAGFYQELFGGIFAIDYTFFIQKYDSMIKFGSGTYENVDGEVKNRGAEITSVLKLSDVFKLTYGYTYLKYDDTNNSQAVLKRPSFRHSISAVISPVAGLAITGEYLYVDQRKDLFYNTSTWTSEIVRLNSYHKFDMNIRYAFNETVTLTARGENLTDESYEETYGFNTKGRSFYGGAEITL